MIKRIPYILIVFAFLVYRSTQAQSTASYDGIYVRPSSVNETTFLHGEPIYIYFNVVNEKNVSNPYYIPQRQINVQLTLRNRETNETYGGEEWSQVSHKRNRWQHQPPTKEYSFRPKEDLVFQVYVDDEFGTERLAEPTYYNALAKRLRILPVGKYELTVKYALFPSAQTLSSSVSFEVQTIDQANREALRQFVKSTTYACNSHYLGEDNYQSNHSDSYENFLKHYSYSPYSQYAFVDMVTQIYSHKGIPEPVRTKKFRSYYDYFPQIKNGGLKMYYAVHLPRVIKYIPGTDVKDSLDEFLRTQLVDENPDISNALIDAAKFYTGVEGLKNYAKTAIPR